MNDNKKNEDLKTSDSALWVDIKTVAEIKNITSRAIRLAFVKGKYTFRETITQGGKSYEILLSSLEPKVQEIYKNTYYRQRRILV